MTKGKQGTLTEKEFIKMYRMFENICKGKHINCNNMPGVCERCGLVGIDKRGREIDRSIKRGRKG